MFVSDFAINRNRIKLKEFGNHPVTISAYPDSDSEIMTKFAHNIFGSPGNDDGDNQRWENHG